MAITKITPLTTFEILRGVNLDPSYSDVMTHASSAARDSYFSDKVKYRNVDAIPVKNNVVRVPYVADVLYDCNYIRWKNGNFGNRWFYGFIRSVRWVNANASNVEIEEDIWETWQFDTVQFLPCFIERQHVLDDSFGLWLEPEPLDTSNRVYLFRGKTDYGNNMKMIMYFIDPVGDEKVSESGGIVNMCSTHVFDKNSAKDTYENIIQPMIDLGLQDNIIGIYAMPNFVATAWQTGTGTYTKTFKRNDFMNIDGYYPSNVKLLTFPFNSITMGSQNGLQAEYRLEYLPPNIQLKVYGSTSPDLVLYAVIDDYFSGYSSNEVPNMAYTNISSGWPQGMFSGMQTLGYAQAVSSLGMQATAGIRQNLHQWIPKLIPATKEGSEILAERHKGNLLGKIYEGMGNLLENVPDDAIDQIGTGKEMDIARAAVGDYSQVGQLPSSTTAFHLFKGEFALLQTCIDRKRAMLYDSYLTRWGYAINKVDIPQKNGRKVFNFIKTNGAVVKANAPQYAINMMRSMLNRGVTFWHQERGYEPGSWVGGADGNEILGE